MFVMYSRVAETSGAAYKVMSLMEDATRASAAKSARKRNRKSRANREPSSVSGAPGSIPTGSPSGNAAGGEPAGTPTGALSGGNGMSEVETLVIDVVCGVNRAKLRVDGLRNGSKTPCVYMDTDTEELGQGQGQGQGQGEGKGQERSGKLCFDSCIRSNN